MKIGVLGTGNMGSTLAELCGEQLIDIMLGSRDPDKAKDLAWKMGECVRGGSIAEAPSFGEVVALCVPWHAAKETLEAAGPLEGKALVDITNPFKPRLGGLEVGFDTSAAEQIAAWAPEAHVVKAFNAIHHDNLLAPDFDGQAASNFLCGDDPEAKAKVAALSKEIGFDPIDCGPLEMARYLEPLAFLWVYVANRQGEGRDTAFKWLRRG